MRNEKELRFVQPPLPPLRKLLFTCWDFSVFECRDLIYLEFQNILKY